MIRLPPRLSEVSVFLGILTLAALYLSQSLWAGLTDADTARVAFHAIASADRVRAADAANQVATLLANERGGFFPFARIVVAFWMAGPSEAVARAVQFTLVLADVAAFQLVARRLLGRGGAALAVVGTLCALVYHKYHDPVLGLTLEMPLLALLVFMSLEAWLRAIGGHRLRLAWLGASLAAYGSACLFHPAAYGFAVIFPIALVSSRVPSRAGVLGASAFLALPSIALIGTAYAGIASAFARIADEVQRGSYLRSALHQFAAAIPFVERSHASIAGNGIPVGNGDTRFAAVPPSRASTWIVAAAASGIAAVALRARRGSEGSGTLAAAGIGAAMWAVPALLLGQQTLWALAAFPRGLPLGASFPSVYLEAFGAGLVMAAFLRAAAVAPWGRGAFVAVGAPLVIGLTLYGNQRANYRIVDSQIAANGARVMLARSAAAGLFAGLPDGTVIAFDGTAGLTSDAGPRSARYALFAATGHRFSVEPLARLHDERPGPRTWVYHASGASAFATLSHVGGIRGDVVLADSGRRFSDPADARSRALDRRIFFSASRGVERRSREVGSGVASVVRATCGPVPLDRLFYALSPRLRIGSGFIVHYVGEHLPRGETPEPLRRAFRDAAPIRGYRLFARNEAQLAIVPDPCPAAALRFSAVVATEHPSVVEVRSPYGRTRFRAGPHGTRFTLRFPPTSSVIPLSITTDAPPATIDPEAPRDDAVPPLRIAMLVADLDASIEGERR